MIKRLYKRPLNLREPFCSSGNKILIQEESPDNKEGINDYKLYVEPVLEFELLCIDLELRIEKLLYVIRKPDDDCKYSIPDPVFSGPVQVET